MLWWSSFSGVITAYTPEYDVAVVAAKLVHESVDFIQITRFPVVTCFLVYDEAYGVTVIPCDTVSRGEL